MPYEFEVKILGKKNRLHWEMDTAGRIRCYVTVEPLSEDANRELITALAESIGVNKSKVELVHGVEDYTKVFKITDSGVNGDDVLRALGLSSAKRL